MVNLKIDGIKVSVKKGTTLMEAAGKIGINIPHLCYLEGINDIGACRVCVVENAGTDKLLASCNTMAEEGMDIFTNSHKVRKARRTNVELLLSEHDCLCATCVRSGNCELQKVANDLGILEFPYHWKPERNKWDKDFPLIRDASKCIKCMRCVQICDKIQDLHVWDVNGSGPHVTVGVAEGSDMQKADCSLCGQCITHCPTGALRERNDIDKMYEALEDPETVTIVQVAPAVRAAWGEGIGLPKNKATLGRMVNGIRKLGFDYIFDTNFTADLTIMEEGSEFLERFKNKENYSWPMFTSCCPAWVRFVKTQYPDMVKQLSTAKSPQQMFGAMIKTYIAKHLGVDPKKIFSVSVMPCTAKKYERGVEQVNDSGYGSDVDIVLTTREINRMMRASHVNPDTLKNEEFDDVFGIGSGAAVIFGATGGVMEAALRSAYFLLTGKNPDPDAFKKVRGMEGWKEAEFDVSGATVRVAVASGLANTRKLIEAIRAGEVNYDFVEIMACPGGCAGGGGQPINEGEEMAEDRGKILYGLDKVNELRFSHENPAILKSYEEFLGKPLGHKSHQLLHTDLTKWDIEVKQ
ncbi:MAG TPA: NADH-dependent [FeFe] hydrogenase, group A6 [Bacillota bacterium]|nr:NADH-dependent [FeFe] hydrogenase, group A6 [Bacillota bacterium]HUM56556.1 NADH-dependent [FeFe] hydrogenase, group A6 [Bacillota bacterium]